MSPKKQAAKGGRGPSAYMLFANEQRAATHAELIAAGGKAGIAEVGKALGVKWGQLSDEDKQRYKDLAVQKARERKEETEAQQAAASPQQQLQQQGEGDGGDDAGDEQPAASTSAAAAVPFGFPTSLVKKIALVDPEVKRIGADAVRAIAKSTQLFVESLAVRALDHARSVKRKNFKFDDVVAVAKRDRRLVELGLPDVLERDPVFAAVHERAAEENEAKVANQGKRAAEKDKAPKGVPQITAFFAREQNAAGAAAADAVPAHGSSPEGSEADAGVEAADAMQNEEAEEMEVA